jgi:hypothetical protein
MYFQVGIIIMSCFFYHKAGDAQVSRRDASLTGCKRGLYSPGYRAMHP